MTNKRKRRKSSIFERYKKSSRILSFFVTPAGLTPSSLTKLRFENRIAEKTLELAQTFFCYSIYS
jgi:hypothetical protein